MRARCRLPSNCAFRWYGAKGITVCERWYQSFDAFLADMGPKPTPAHTLDRIDATKGYEPGNCRWATQTEQQRNRTNNRRIEFNGEWHTLSEWDEIMGWPRATLHGRLRHGWTVAEAFATPCVLRKRRGHPG